MHAATLSPRLLRGARYCASAPPKPAPEALREKARTGAGITPGRHLQLEFSKTNTRGLHRLPRPRGRGELCVSRRSAHFDNQLPGPSRRFLPTRPPERCLPLMLGSLPRRRVTDAGAMQSETPSAGEELAPFGRRTSFPVRPPRAAASPPPTRASNGLAPSNASSAATDDALDRARQRSPTSAIDAKPEHDSPAIVSPAASMLFTPKQSRLTAREGGALRLPGRRRETPAHRPFSSGASNTQGAEADSRTESGHPCRGLGLHRAWRAMG